MNRTPRRPTARLAAPPTRPTAPVAARVLAVLLVVGASVLALPTDAAQAAAPRCAGLRATILGTAGPDVIRGTPRADVIVARGGNDRIVGRGGRDVICGGAGNDVIATSTTGGARLFGDGGTDRISANGPNDRIDGGAGNDVLLTTARGVRIKGGSGDDRITGGRHDDVLEGGADDDRIHGGLGADTIRGDGGIDRIWTDGGRDDAAWGGIGDDLLHGDSPHSLLSGGAGDDWLEANAAEIVLVGGDGDDQLNGAPTPTVVDGGFGDDLILLGDGADTNVHGGPGSDDINGGGGDDVLHADDGVDQCHGGNGVDTCHGGAPLGPENSAADPDKCDAEEMTSCGEGELPVRWILHLEGRSDFVNGEIVHTVSNWTVNVPVEKYFAQDGKTWYFAVTSEASGSWTAEGESGNCSITGSGTLGPDSVGATVLLDAVAGTWGLQWGGLNDTTGEISCPEGVWDYDIHSGVDDTRTGLVWDPLYPFTVLSGSGTSPSDEGTVATYSWSLTPVQILS